MSSAFNRFFAFSACCLFAAAAQASPITFNFTYSGANITPPPPALASPKYPNAPKAASGNSAVITGSVTFESTLLPNPGVLDVNLPNPAVLALNVTVTGASAGNGTYGLSDFAGIVFNTGGGTLDFNQPLIGQPTSTSTWGALPSSGEAGDFNLFGLGSPNSAPIGEDYFTLCTNGGSGDCTQLVSAINAAAASATPTPALSTWTLAALAGLLALAGFIGLRRHRTTQ